MRCRTCIYATVQLCQTQTDIQFRRTMNSDLNMKLALITTYIYTHTYTQTHFPRQTCEIQPVTLHVWEMSVSFITFLCGNPSLISTCTSTFHWTHTRRSQDFCLLFFYGKFFSDFIYYCHHIAVLAPSFYENKRIEDNNWKLHTTIPLQRQIPVTHTLSPFTAYIHHTLLCSRTTSIFTQ